MKIQYKIMLFTTLFLLLMVTLLTAMSVNSIQRQGESRLTAYKAEAIADVKSNLKDLVDVAYETIDSGFKNLSDVRYLSKFYERRLHNIIDTGETILRRYQAQVASGKISLQEAKQRAAAEIKALRFDDGTGYIWINDTGEPFPRMVMHPTVPSLDGKRLDSQRFNNALGINKNLFQAFVEITKDTRDGYVDYLWPKPTPDGVSETQEPKLSYVRRYNEWGWILGTGIYIDDARIDMEENIKQAIKHMRYADGTGYFWINDNQLPYPTMVMHPTVPDLDGKVLDSPEFNNALGISKNLFQAFAEVTANSTEGTGFVDYLWPKPTPQGLTPNTPKMSYVRLHKPTGWIIGSGIYIDNIDKNVSARELAIREEAGGLIRNNLIAAVLFLVLALAASYFYAATLSKPIRTLTEVAEQISKGKNLDSPIVESARSDEIGELARSIDRLKKSTKIMMERMRKR